MNKPVIQSGNQIVAMLFRAESQIYSRSSIVWDNKIIVWKFVVYKHLRTSCFPFSYFSTHYTRAKKSLWLHKTEKNIPAKKYSSNPAIVHNYRLEYIQYAKKNTL